MNGYESRVKAILAEHGWRLLRPGKGSHEIWVGPKGDVVTVNYVCKSRHTANEIMKVAGIKHKF